MQIVSVPLPVPLPFAPGYRPGAVPPDVIAWRSPRHVDDEFVTMLNAYRGSGGLARADEVVALLERRGRPGVSALARWIVERSVISFEWQAQTWLPWFQFAHPQQVPEPSLGAVLAELATVYDGWDLAHWFVRPNSALAERRPVEALARDPAGVLQAARADRFVVRG